MVFIFQFFYLINNSKVEWR